MPFVHQGGSTLHQGYAIAQGNSGGALSRLDPVLALTSKREPFDARNNMQQSFQSKSEAFAKRSIYLEVFFEASLFDTANTFMTNVIFPHRRFDDINFSWRYVNFPSMPAVRTAQQAGPVTMTFQQSYGQATMSRYALAVKGLDEDQRTSTGKTFLAGMIGMMAHGFHSMFELNGFRAIKNEDVLFSKYFFESQLYGVDLSRKFGFELLTFDITRRCVIGFQNLTNEVQDMSSKIQGFRFSHAVIPEGMRSIISKGKEMRHANLRGPGAKAMTDLQGDAPELQNVFAGVKLLVARSYYFDGAGVKINPLERSIIFGSFSIYDDFRPSLNNGSWRSCMAEASIFSVDDKRFVWMTTKWLISNSSRFNADGILTRDHNEIAENGLKIAAARNLPTTDNRLDMFIYALATPDNKIQFEVCSHWGHMERWALMDHVVSGIGSVLSDRISDMIGMDAARAVHRGIATIDQIRSKTITDVDEIFMRLAALPVINIDNGERVTHRQSQGNEYGAHDLPTRADFLALDGVEDDDVDGYVPAGFGTFGGLLTIGTQSGTSTQKYGYIAESVRKVAIDFVEATKLMMKAYEAIFHAPDPQNPTRVQRTHPALLEEHVPSFYRSSAIGQRGKMLNAFLAFGYNMLTGVHLPVYLSSIDADGVQVQMVQGIEPLDGDNALLASITDTLKTSGAPQTLINEFGSNDDFNRFVSRFNQSRFAAAYRLMLLGGSSVVGTRSSSIRVQGESLEMVEDEELLDTGDIARRFFLREVVSGDRSIPQQLAILARAVFYVNSGKSPGELSTAILDGWRANSADILTAAAALNVPTVGALNANMFLTRLSVPHDRLGRGMRLASPLNPGTQLRDDANAGMDALLDNSTIDIEQTTIFSGARAHGGLRRTANATATSTTPSAMFGISTAQPTMTGTVMTDLVVSGSGATQKTWRRTNLNISNRWKAAGSIPNVLNRIAQRMFLIAPINRAVACSFSTHNIKSPFSHIAARPNKRYTAEAIIYLSLPTGSSIGFTATHDPRVNYVHNGTTETFFIHMVLYTETIITHGNRILIVPDARITGYGGGDGSAPFSQANYDPDTLRDMPELIDGKQSPSVLVFMQPAGSLYGPLRHTGRAVGMNRFNNPSGLFGKVFDIRGQSGRVKRGNFGGAAVRAAMTGKTQSAFAQYHSALFYNYVFPFNQLKVPGQIRACKLKDTNNMDNTVVLQEMQRLRLTGGGVADAKIDGIDHWGNSAVEGGDLLRRGISNESYDTLRAPVPLQTISD